MMRVNRKNKLSRPKLYGFFCALIALTLSPSCKEDDTEEKQRENIERYITVSLKAEIDVKDGVYYVPITVDSSPDRVAIAPGDVVELEYEAMTLGGAIFATSDTSTAAQNGLETLEATGLEVGTGKLIAGLDRGLQRMALHEQAYLIFPFTLGYGAQHVGMVPSQSALIFNIFVKKVKKSGS
jgi:FKBP-type peptidyl-prolyl cis-trans isomerase